MKISLRLKASRLTGGRAGHTLIELMVVTTLMTLLTYLVAQVWRPLAQTTNSLRLRSSASTEIGMAKEFLRRDFGGVEKASATPDGGLHLQREFEVANRIRSLSGGSDDPGVRYKFADGKLFRKDMHLNEEFEVAHDLKNFEVVPQGNGDLNIEISGGDGKNVHQLTLVWRQ